MHGEALEITMNFDLTEEQQLVVQTARDFATREIEPKAAELDKTGRWPREIVAQMAELGFLGMAIPTELLVAYGTVGMLFMGDHSAAVRAVMSRSPHVEGAVTEVLALPTVTPTAEHESFHDELTELTLTRARWPPRSRCAGTPAPWPATACGVRPPRAVTRSSGGRTRRRPRR